MLAVAKTRSYLAPDLYAHPNKPRLVDYTMAAGKKVAGKISFCPRTPYYFAVLVFTPVSNIIWSQVLRIINYS